jgi:hypothetical protein
MDFLCPKRPSPIRLTLPLTLGCQLPSPRHRPPPRFKFVEVEVVRKCVPTYLRTHDADGMPYTGEPTPFDEQGNPVRQGGDKLGTIPPGINFMMEAREAVHFQRARVVLPTYSSIS